LGAQDVYVTGRTLEKAKTAVADVATTATGQAALHPLQRWKNWVNIGLKLFEKSKLKSDN